MMPLDYGCEREDWDCVPPTISSEKNETRRRNENNRVAVVEKGSKKRSEKRSRKSTRSLTGRDGEAEKK